ncbi:CotH kinase family protein [Sphingobacterium hotanense]|uniref:CotH kinase family protein n=1 Tax=Sphingobacterium hotanense TaxID=649196 RepID=UPI0011F0FA59|nr:CotH kinase family protein [Sphingobacterium hotanense]
MDSQLNKLSPLIDFDNALIPGQMPNENAFRSAPFKDLVGWLQGQLDIRGAELLDPVAPGTQASPALIPLGPEDSKGKFEPQPGFYQGFPEVTANKRWYFYWNGSSWSLKDMGALPKGADGKTIEQFNATKPQGYVAGDQLFFNNEAIYQVKVGQTATTGQSPATHPEKFDVVFEGGKTSFAPKPTVVMTDPTNLAISNTGLIITTNATKKGWQNVEIKEGDKVTYFYKLDTFGADGVWIKKKGQSTFSRLADVSPVVRGTNYGSFIADSDMLLNIASNLTLPELTVEKGNAVNERSEKTTELLSDKFTITEIPLDFSAVGNVSDAGVGASTGWRNASVFGKKGDIYAVETTGNTDDLRAILVKTLGVNSRENVIQMYFKNPLQPDQLISDAPRAGKPFVLESDGYLILATPTNATFTTRTRLYKITGLAKDLRPFIEQIESTEILPLVKAEKPTVKANVSTVDGKITFLNRGALEQISSIAYTAFTAVKKGEMVNASIVTATQYRPTIYFRRKGDLDYSQIPADKIELSVFTETVGGVSYTLNRYIFKDVLILWDGAIIIGTKTGHENTTGGIVSVQNFTNGSFSFSIKRRKDNLEKPTNTTSVVLANKPNFLRLDLYGAINTDPNGSEIENFAKLSYPDGRFISSGYMATAVQGRGSAMFAKKGYTLEIKNLLGKEIKYKFGYFPETDSFHLKAFWSDNTMAKDVGNARLWFEMAKTRSWPHNKINNKTSVMDTTMSDAEAYDADALYHTDGIPIEVYFDDVFHGLYMNRLKKHRSNYGMDSANNNHIFLDASSSNLTAYFHEPFDSVDWEVRNPKISGYEGENMPVPAGPVLDSINRFFNWGTGVFNGSINLRTTYQDYIVLESWLDYAIWGELIYHVDSYGNNLNAVTWDATRWSLTPYDTDASMGARNTGQTIDLSNNDLIMSKGLLNRILVEFLPELKARYTYLRKSGVISDKTFDDVYVRGLMAHIPRSIYAQNYAKWGGYSGLKLTARHIQNYLHHRMTNVLDSIWLLS